MANGNMFLGGARGSVGDVTLSVVNGQQITKRRNRNPRNPRSKKQMYQRASFAEPVKFFTRGQQNLFKFAFESKGATESDYNAFMRVNAKLGVLMTKEQINNPFIAKFGNFCLTQGSMTGLAADKIAFVETENGSFVGIETNMTVDLVPTTIGELSAVILDSFKSMQAGDIITTLQIVADNLTPGEIPYVVSDQEYEPIWYINQIVLNRDNATPLSAAWTLSKTADNKLVIANLDAPSGEEFCGCSIILSRTIQGGVKVSTSYLKNSTRVQECIALMKPNFDNPDYDNPWVAEVMRSWNAGEEAILQGSLAKDVVERDYVITSFNDEPLPGSFNVSVAKTANRVALGNLKGEELNNIAPGHIKIICNPSLSGYVAGLTMYADHYELRMIRPDGTTFGSTYEGTATVYIDGAKIAQGSLTITES